MKFVFMALLCCVALLRHDPMQSARQQPVKSVKTDTLAWDTETCNFIGTFDTSKFSKKQLRDTYRLWFTYNALQLDSNMRFDPDSYDNFDSKAKLVQLDRDYKERKRDYAQMNLVPGQIWRELLKNRMKDLEDTYELAKINLTAHTRPQALLNNRFSKYCPEYADALASADTVKMMAAWGKLMKEPAMGGYNDEGFKRFKNGLRPSRRIAFAKTYLLIFGWHNCANRQIDHDIPNVNYREEFEKLFLSIEQDCEEP